MFLSKERIYEQYLCAITSTEYCGPDARGKGSPQQSRIEHIIYLCEIDIFLQEVALSQVEREGFAPVIAADSAQRVRSASYRIAGTAWATSPRDRCSVRTSLRFFIFHGQQYLSKQQKDYFALHGAFMARPVAAAVQVLESDLQKDPDHPTASTVVDSIHLLLGSLDRLEDKTGVWHESVTSVTRAAREWDKAHRDRSADTWAAALINRFRIEPPPTRTNLYDCMCMSD
jgi:hypothetical protein